MSAATPDTLAPPVHLRRRGSADGEGVAAIIDWTTLTDFYGRLGAHAWRVYQRAEGDL